MKKTVGCGMFMQFLTVFCYVSDYRIFFIKKQTGAIISLLDVIYFVKLSERSSPLEAMTFLYQ